MTIRFLGFVLSLFALVMGISACSDQPNKAAPAQAVSPPPSANASATSHTSAVSVTTAKVVQRDMPISLKATGTITPLAMVDVKPQTNSIVTKIHIKEGQFVRAGDLLFSLDSRTDEANLAKAKAQLAKDNAALVDAWRQLARNQELVAKGFISQGAADTSQASVDALVATIALDKAAMDAAQVALSYNRIVAAQSGRVGFISVFVGSAVQANQTLMVTITQLDPIAIAFSLPQVNIGDALNAIQGEGTSVNAKLPDGLTIVSGKLKTVDNAVDALSGTIKMKAIFNNKDSKLWPGGFAEINLTARTILGASVVPQEAIIQSARGTIVYVVEGGKSVLRPIKVLFSQNGEAAVSGVKVDEVIVVDGKQNVRPNVPVVERAKPAAAS